MQVAVRMNLLVLSYYTANSQATFIYCIGFSPIVPNGPAYLVPILNRAVITGADLDFTKAGVQSI